MEMNNTTPHTSEHPYVAPEDTAEQRLQDVANRLERKKQMEKTLRTAHSAFGAIAAKAAENTPPTHTDVEQ